MKKEVIVLVEHMDKSFGSTVALKDVSIEVRRGEIQGLIGENGSGKSTVTSIYIRNAESGLWRNVFPGRKMGALFHAFRAGKRNRDDRSGKRNGSGNFGCGKYLPGRNGEV